MNILYYLFLKKASNDNVTKILKDEKFIFEPNDVTNLLKGNQKGSRYGNIVLERIENGEKIKRFFKIVIDGSFRTYKLFRRQLEITNILALDKKYIYPKIKVMKQNLLGLPYGIFETRESGQGYGFMHDESLYYEQFSDHDMERLVNLIYSFHNTGKDLKKDIWKYTQNISSNVNHYLVEMNNFLSKKILHKYSSGSIESKTVEDLLSYYLKIDKIEEKVVKILFDCWSVVKKAQSETKRYLVHGDLQIDNIYKHQNGDFELLDFEWVGNSDNPLVAIMYDYGNLRSRAWCSIRFQSLLDKKMVEIGKKYYENMEIVEAGMTLGKIRSSLMMCRYHLDFTNTVRNDKRTEEQYFTMFPKTIASFQSVFDK